MELEDYRKQIDKLDGEIVERFRARMELAEKIAVWKKENRKPVYDPAREREKILALSAAAPEELREPTAALFSTVFALSRARQRHLIAEKSEVAQAAREALENTAPLLPARATVACQGVEGAFSQSACQKLFRQPEIFFFDSFDGVFRAVDQGLCRYGVLPLENSTAGSVNRVYDLLSRYDFSIVRATRVRVDHCLLANRGATAAGLREIVSHEQALRQSEEYLRGFKSVKITAASNTAAAARLVLESGRTDLAALASRACAELYGLTILDEAVQDSPDNYTRFICLSKKLEIYPGADRVSVMMVLPNRPGALYQLLGRFYALGINLVKLESRPLPGNDAAFLFYFDLECPACSQAFPALFEGLGDECLSYRYLGSYAEVV